MIRTYSYKLYNSKANKNLVKLVELSGEIYNHCIALHNRYYRLYKVHLNKVKLQSHLAKLKKLEQYKHWNNLNSQAIQDITDRIERSYTLFFRNLKRKIKYSPPSFKKRSKYKSFTLKQSGYKFSDDNTILIQKKSYKYFKSREFEGKIKTVTIKRDTIGNFYIFIVCELDNSTNLNKTRSGKSVGLDFGLKTYLTLSNNTNIESPLFFKQSKNKLRKCHKILSSKKKGSNNRKKAIINLARTHNKIVNQRKDFQFKLAKKLCKEYDTLCIEDLNIKDMQKRWGRKVSDLAHSNFVSILKHQSLKYGVDLIEIDRYYASTKTCSFCNSKNDNLELSDRVWTCPTCGEILHRDLNASINILRVGTSTLNGVSVKPLSEVTNDDVRIPCL